MVVQALLSVLCGLIVYFVYYYKKIHYRFETAGLKYLAGVPIFGNVWKSTFLRRHFIYDLEEVYNAFPDEKYVGFVDGMVPVILVRDPELMKTITIKDFDHFQNRKEFFPVRLDPLLGRNVLQLQDEEWKAVRTQLSPAFTGARLRYMLPAMINVSKNVVKSLRKCCFKEVDLTESMYRYTGDSLASAAFGFDQEHAGEEDNVLSEISATIYFNFWRRVLIFISVQFPKLGEILKNATTLFPKKTHNFFRNVISGALEYRKSNNISILDYMDVLQKNCEGKPINDLAGQFFFSYAASLESGSGTLRLCFHELALNSEIQERLYQEIRTHEKLGEITMESINGLKYLDCVLKETSRRWSSAVMMDRICTKRYVLPPSAEGGIPYTVQRGDMVFNVVNPIHMDPKYYTNPEVFDPERFTPENKKTIQPFTFLPFGIGPRGCLGQTVKHLLKECSEFSAFRFTHEALCAFLDVSPYDIEELIRKESAIASWAKLVHSIFSVLKSYNGVRFAILQMKVLIYHMVLYFKLVKCGKTTDPIVLQPDEMNMKAMSGTWVLLEPRE